MNRILSRGEIMAETDEETNDFDIKIVGSSTIYTEQEIIDLIYEALKDKAIFKIQ